MMVMVIVVMLIVVMVIVVMATLVLPVEDELSALVKAHAVDYLCLTTIEVVSIELTDDCVISIAVGARRGHEDQSASIESVVTDEVVGHLLFVPSVISYCANNSSYPWEGRIGRPDFDLCYVKLCFLEVALVAVIIHLIAIKYVSGVCG